MGASTDLNDVAAEYLEICNVALADTPGGQLDRRYVSVGLPAFDCCDPGQLTVHVGGALEADTAPVAPALQAGHRIQTTGVVNMIVLTATVIRCVPVASTDGKNVPTIVQLSAASEKIDADLWAIWNHLVHGKRTGVYFAPNERELVLEPAFAINTQGGCGGWQIPIRVQLSGYQPVLPTPPAP